MLCHNGKDYLLICLTLALHIFEHLFSSHLALSIFNSFGFNDECIKVLELPSDL